jgi:hypothetical protein
VKRLLIFLALSIFLFNWIGYQLYTSVASPASITYSDQRALQGADLYTVKMPVFHISLYEKEMDFDDLLEFTATPNYSVNEIYFSFSDDLFPDHANKENQRASFKCFNGEYYFGSDKLFSKYSDAYSSSKEPDRYLLNIPSVFLGPQEHPPQYIG